VPVDVRSFSSIRYVKFCEIQSGSSLTGSSTTQLESTISTTSFPSINVSPETAMISSGRVISTVPVTPAPARSM
jgi:hypothetical protein